MSPEDVILKAWADSIAKRGDWNDFAGAALAAIRAALADGSISPADLGMVETVCLFCGRPSSDVAPDGGCDRWGTHTFPWTVVES